MAGALGAPTRVCPNQLGNTAAAIHHRDTDHREQRSSSFAGASQSHQRKVRTWASLACPGKGPWRGAAASLSGHFCRWGLESQKTRKCLALCKGQAAAGAGDTTLGEQGYCLACWGGLLIAGQRVCERASKAGECPQENPACCCKDCAEQGEEDIHPSPAHILGSTQPCGSAANPPLLRLLLQPPAFASSCLELVLISLLVSPRGDPWISGIFPGPGLITSWAGLTPLLLASF